jgi:hypothetical protein
MYIILFQELKLAYDAVKIDVYSSREAHVTLMRYLAQYPTVLNLISSHITVGNSYCHNSSLRNDPSHHINHSYYIH